MLKILGALLSIFVLHTSVHGADKIRIGFPDLAATFVSLAVGEKRGFFQEQGIQAEFIRINPAIALQAVVGGEIDYYTVLGLGLPLRFGECRSNSWLLMCRLLPPR